MALPKIIERLFESSGLGQYLHKDIIPNHADIHQSNGRDPVAIDASQITTGVISPFRLPDSVKERGIRVKDDAALLALTQNDVQNGDDVLVSSTGVWYKVIDDTRLDKKSGYLKFGTVNISDTGEIGHADTANRFATPIRLIMTGANGISDLWDGSTNLLIDVTSIDPDLLKLHNPVTYVSFDTVVTKEHANNILCCDRELTVHVNSEDMENGWYFYVKNTSDEFFCTVTGFVENENNEGGDDTTTEGDGSGSETESSGDDSSTSTENGSDDGGGNSSDGNDTENNGDGSESGDGGETGGDTSGDDSGTTPSTLTFEGLSEYLVPPLITVKFVFDGANFIAISNAPIVTDGKLKI